jgi:hypothetical protein
VFHDDKELPTLNIIIILSVLCVMRKIILLKIFQFVNSVTVFWDVTASNLLSRFWRFGGKRFRVVDTRTFLPF